MSPLLLAAIEPPADLSTWVGGLVLTTALTAFVTAMLTSYGKSGDKADKVMADAALAKAGVEAEWKAELRNTLKQLLDGQQTHARDAALMAKDITLLQSGYAQLAERQKEQALAHIRAIDAIRSEPHVRPLRGKR